MSEAMWFGLGGALLGCGLEIAALRNVPSAQRPSFKDFYYVFPFFLWIAAGAFLVAMYEANGVKLNPPLAVNIGISAPVILRTMVANSPKEPPINPGTGA